MVRFLRFFADLDGSPFTQDPQVTLACVSALFDRMLNPPESDQDVPPSESDIDRATSALHELIEREAGRVRHTIRNAQQDVPFDRCLKNHDGSSTE